LKKQFHQTNFKILSDNQTNRFSFAKTMQTDFLNIPKSKTSFETDHLKNSYPFPILNEIIIHQQAITEMKYLMVTDRNNIFKETGFVKLVMFPFSTSHLYHHAFLHF